MKIANPIYDVVFKYLMDDKKIAKLIISKIIGEEIESLDLRPTEIERKIEGRSFTVFRIDFSAMIRHADGSKKLVVIEIQKAKLSTDIMRFRRYLGHQYQDKNNIYTDEATGKIKALPIISLYFLGHKLEHNDVPVIQVKRNYIDLAENRELPHKEVFIESLTHDSYVIQIPALRKNRRTNLEMLLSIFDQRYKTPQDDHYLDLKKEDYPNEFHFIMKRLLKAGSEANVCQTMDLEDEILNELEIFERSSLKKVEKAEEKAEKEKAEKEKALHHAMNALTKRGLSSKEAAEILGVSMDAKK